MDKVIIVDNLVKKYKKVTAVDDISFFVQRGEVFGLLGENGAGKTTTLEIIEGLRKATNGSISVLGHNIQSGLADIKEKIGVQLQASAYFEFLTLYEILDLYGSFYKKHLPPLELLKRVKLTEKRKSYITQLSGGQKQRFSIIASLINDPDIVFLDEPTTGLDPISRRNLWHIINQIKSQGKTIILTTHYLEEAEILCDRVAILERGKIIIQGKTTDLINHIDNPFKLNFSIAFLPEAVQKQLESLGQIKQFMNKTNHYELKLKTSPLMYKALDIIKTQNPDTLIVGRASLEDLFINLTGKTISDEEIKTS